MPGSAGPASRGRHPLQFANRHLQLFQQLTGPRVLGRLAQRLCEGAFGKGVFRLVRVSLCAEHVRQLECESPSERVSRSTVSLEAIAASEAALQQLLERRFDDVELLIIYIDGMHFGEQCVLAAVGVDVEGRKHVLAIREGATENAEAAKDLLEHLVSQGVDPGRRRLFTIDGSKALRTAINAVFGAETPVQRCRNHKLRNVLGRLPREQQAQTASLMRAAWKLNEKDGMAKFRQMAGWLEHDYPDAARSLLGLLLLPSALR